MSDDIRSGLEGVVAFATEIAEPDRAGRVASLPSAKYVGPGGRPLSAS